MSTTSIHTYSRVIKWPHHTRYSITPEDIDPKTMTCYVVRVSNWHNKRRVYVDHIGRVIYLEITADFSGCHRCSICEERMQETGSYGKEIDAFVTLQNHSSLFKKMPVTNWTPGPEKDITLDWLKKALWYVKDWPE